MTAYPTDTRLAFTAIVALVAVARLVELRLSASNRRSLLARGGVEVGAGHYPAMISLHVAFLVASPLEVWLLDRPFVPLLALAAGFVLVAAMLLRVWVVHTLGPRWTTRVVALPGAPLAAGGPYRWLRHPNYLAVSLEMAALPLVHTAWLSALVFSTLNGVLLGVRIAAEEATLERKRC